MILQSRECLADIANALNLTTAVEVGTHQGVFAKLFMQRFRGGITLVDPWDGFTEGEETYYPAVDETSRDRSHDMHIAMIAMDDFIGRYSVFRTTSEQAAPQFEDEEIGIVYIDALHDYDNVRRDIELWYPKVHKGGILAGHDFVSWIPDVVRAVEEFRKSSGLRVYLTNEDVASWWVVKNVN